MRRSEDEIIDPTVAAQLAAIDATLAGEPVDPSHAELAELALLLAAGRPEPDRGFAAELDEQVAGRFGSSSDPAPGRRGFSWPSIPVLGSALAASVAAVVAVVSLGSGAPKQFASETAKTPQTVSTASAASAASPQVPAAVARRLAPLGGVASNAVSRSTASSVRSFAPSVGSATVVPSANGRKIVQSAQLALNTAPTRVDDVAQEIFDVVGSVHGIVSRSNVTATGGSDGYAHFELSLPSASLPDAMARLSRLRYASVASRTDNTQDVNGSFVSAGRRLSDAQALRTALLKQLAVATTATQVSSLRTQIRDAEGAIAQAQADLRSLNHRVNFSTVSVSVAAAQATPTPAPQSSGFTLHRALHDAGRVLTVAAGVALITLAVLVPVGLVGLLGWWIALTLRRRRREHALDLA